MLGVMLRGGDMRRMAEDVVGAIQECHRLRNGEGRICVGAVTVYIHGNDMSSGRLWMPPQNQVWRLIMMPTEPPGYGGNKNDVRMDYFVNVDDGSGMGLGWHTSLDLVAETIASAHVEAERQALAERVWRECCECHEFLEIPIDSPTGIDALVREYGMKSKRDGYMIVRVKFNKISTEECRTFLRDHMAPGWKIRNAVREQG